MDTQPYPGPPARSSGPHPSLLQPGWGGKCRRRQTGGGSLDRLLFAGGPKAGAQLRRQLTAIGEQQHPRPNDGKHGPRFLHQHAPGSGKTEIICLLASELLRLGKADSVVVQADVRRGSGCKQGCTVSAHYSVGSRLHPSLEKVKSNGRATALVSRVGRTTASQSLQSSSPSSSHHYHHRSQTLVLIIITAIIITIPSPPSPTNNKGGGPLSSLFFT